MTIPSSASNLPRRDDSNDDVTKRFFNTYYTSSLAFPSNEVDAVVGFFESKGFAKSAAQSVGAVLMQQAKIDGVKVFELLDTLVQFDKIQLSFTVAQIINFNRQKISTLGFKVAPTKTPLESRNIMD